MNLTLCELREAIFVSYNTEPKIVLIIFQQTGVRRGKKLDSGTSKIVNWRNWSAHEYKNICLKIFFNLYLSLWVGDYTKPRFTKLCLLKSWLKWNWLKLCIAFWLFCF